ncbi:type II toxin-antitoxin system VapC family toxin [Isoptericola variabilis]|uniref:Ribonuclease VapC n=1 Tax=Isoptericola variabilis (strain 225) TaxID=743718 RepID=F6FQ05_ISOV2|nr:type II toxin-antitoxin system VapC family toxin [Isoptericola variabilis]AEG44811.1 PilT protein domain protein [Isoptericola variabilis 225]
MHYLDTSALVKLVVREPESAALKKWVDANDDRLVSSDLARTELLRAVRRAAPEHAVTARAVLDAVDLLALTTADFEAAAHLDPDIVRSLDALHLATALRLGDELESMVTYDVRLADAARYHGVAVTAPGSPSRPRTNPARTGPAGARRT